MYNVPPYRVFDPHQQATLVALCGRVIPQVDRPADRRVPIAPWIDQRCYNRVTDGFRYDDMPPNDVAWAWGLEGLDQTAQALCGGRFANLSGGRQDEVIRAIRDGEPPGDVWRRMPARRWWHTFAAREIAGVYYAHPAAWDEIGFGGPAYPRGYFALNHGASEPWEAREVPPDEGEGG